jgi:hypothetical protein
MLIDQGFVRSMHDIFVNLVDVLIASSATHP